MQEESTKSRLRWRCRRGMLELDELLLAFLERRYALLSHTEQQVFHELLARGDQELFGLLFKNEPANDPRVTDVVEQIRRAAGP